MKKYEKVNLQEVNSMWGKQIKLEVRRNNLNLEDGRKDEKWFYVRYGIRGRF